MPFNHFVHFIKHYEQLIKSHSLQSWHTIDQSQDEPAIIRDYLLKARVGVDYLNRNISSEVNRTGLYTMKFASVYCHKKPRVRRTEASRVDCEGNTNECELGDLMIVLLFIDKEKTILHRAAHLCQAKKHRQLDSQSQQCLYEVDSDFEMPDNVVKQSVTKTSLRHLPNYTQERTKALSYLILDNQPTVRQIPWAANMEFGFEHFIFRFLIGDLGKSFTTPNSGDSEWDCIIDDLINVGTGKVASSIKRSTGLAYILDRFNYYYYLPEYKEDNDFEGIPTIYIIVQENEVVQTATNSE